MLVLNNVIVIDKKLLWRPRDLLEFDTSLFKTFLVTCIPLVITDGLFGISTSLQTVVLGQMDDAAIAANSVASTLYQLLKVASVGSAGAASVIIGRTVGEGRIEKTKEYTKTMQLIFVGIGILTGISLFILRTPIISMCKISDEAKVLADGFLLVLCVTGIP